VLQRVSAHTVVTDKRKAQWSIIVISAHFHRKGKLITSWKLQLN